MNILRRIKRKLFPVKAAPAPPKPAPVKVDWDKPFEGLREKWQEVPYRNDRAYTSDLMALSDEELKAKWESARDDVTIGKDQFQHRGWFHLLYKDFICGKKVIDIGCGFATDSITFAMNGAEVTFIDLAPANVNLVKRLCKIFGIDNAQFLVLEDLSSLKTLANDYDVVMAIGSLHHAPASVISSEVQELIRHLKPGGRWLQLTYPKARWEREGKQPFDLWGQAVDGDRTPWAEWYDTEKLIGLFGPVDLDLVFYYEFHNNDFNWFDLLYKGPRS